MLSRYLKLTLAWVILINSTPAFAYIDPGTGSALIQGIIAGIAAIGVTFKLYWHRIMAFFQCKGAKDNDAESEAEK